MKPSVLLSRLAVVCVAGISTVSRADPAARNPSNACRRRWSIRPRTMRSWHIKRFSLPQGLKASLWAAEPMLANPVAIDFDEKGRLFVSETYRYRTSVLDIRDYMGMLELDLASRTIEDRVGAHPQGVRRGAGQAIRHRERVRAADRGHQPRRRRRQEQHSTPKGSTASSTASPRACSRATARCGSPTSPACGCWKASRAT